MNLDSVRIPFGANWEIAGLKRLLFIGSISLAAVFSLFALQAFQGEWHWVAETTHVSQFSAEAIPIPIAFLLWVHLMEKKGQKFTLGFSLVFCILTIEFLTMGQVLWKPLKQQVLVIGVTAGLFMFISFRECLVRAKNDIRPAIVAVIAATAAINYYELMRTLWEEMSNWTKIVVAALLRLFRMDISSTDVVRWDPSFPPNLTIKSPYFGIQVYGSCNGLEGIFLFMFMLSAMLLIDWDMFKRRSITLLYGFGIIYMFFFNALRIFTFFTLGYWAYNPRAWNWVHSFQGAPLSLFHSYVGWGFYLWAFGIFAAWMYWPRLDTKPDGGA
jgi:exosortase/archaeosortase family protein